MNFSRRNFLRGILSVPIVVGLPEKLVPRPSLVREPFVRTGTTVSYIGLALHPAPTFIGSRIVKLVMPWNGAFYPIVLDNGYMGSHTGTEIFSDHDLSDFQSEIPPKFWHTRSVEDWPNVHAWVRYKRYGEHPDVMRARSFAIRSGTPWPLNFA